MRRNERAEAEIPADARDFLEGRTAPLASAMIAGIAALITAAFAWMAWAEVDEVVRAEGRVEPAGRVKLINHPSGGKVGAIHVEEGQRVEAGDVLITFDGQVDEHARAELEGRYEVKRAEIARLQAEVGGTPLRFDAALEAARPDLVAQQSELREARADAFASERRSLEQQVEGRRNDRRSAMADVSRLRNSLELLEEQLTAVRELAERGLYPKLKMVEIQRQVSDHEGELARARSELAAAEAALAESESRLASLEKDRRRELLDALSEATAERDRLREQLEGKAKAMADLTVEAPVDGVIQELAVSAAGQSVGANEPIMKLVPVGDGLVVKARVANDDIGRVVDGMHATVKVRAFDYARFGSLEGRVAEIAADASRPDEDAPPSYEVTVLTERTHLGEDGRHAVVPGMLVDVELRVGERTVLSYLTDRIVDFREGAFQGG